MQWCVCLTNRRYVETVYKDNAIIRAECDFINRRPATTVVCWLLVGLRFVLEINNWILDICWDMTHVTLTVMLHHTYGI